jgi:hypothetical protein
MLPARLDMPAMPEGVRHMRKVFLIAISSVLAISVFVVSGGVAHASERQYCVDDYGVFACFNAYGGGPYVNIDNNPDLQNDYFTVILSPWTGDYEIEFIGGGSWSGKCIGDAKNDSGLADTSLDSCATASGGGGWGTDDIEYSCGDGLVAFRNTHWGGWIAPDASFSNGKPFYLNDPEEVCFAVLSN